MKLIYLLLLLLLLSINPVQSASEESTLVLSSSSDGYLSAQLVSSTKNSLLWRKHTGFSSSQFDIVKSFDLNDDGIQEIVALVKNRYVRVYDSRTGNILSEYLFDPKTTFSSLGVEIGDVNGDDRNEIVISGLQYFSSSGTIILDSDLQTLSTIRLFNMSGIFGVHDLKLVPYLGQDEIVVLRNFDGGYNITQLRLTSLGIQVHWTREVVTNSTYRYLMVEKLESETYIVVHGNNGEPIMIWNQLGVSVWNGTAGSRSIMIHDNGQLLTLFQNSSDVENLIEMTTYEFASNVPVNTLYFRNTFEVSPLKIDESSAFLSISYYKPGSLTKQLVLLDMDSFELTEIGSRLRFKDIYISDHHSMVDISGRAFVLTKDEDNVLWLIGEDDNPLMFGEGITEDVISLESVRVNPGTYPQGVLLYEYEKPNYIGVILIVLFSVVALAFAGYYGYTNYLRNYITYRRMLKNWAQSFVQGMRSALEIREIDDLYFKGLRSGEAENGLVISSKGIDKPYWTITRKEYFEYYEEMDVDDWSTFADTIGLKLVLLDVAILLYLFRIPSGSAINKDIYRDMNISSKLYHRRSNKLKEYKLVKDTIIFDSTGKANKGIEITREGIKLLLALFDLIGRNL